MSADDLSETAIRRLNPGDLESAGLRRESAEAVYRLVATLRDLLPTESQKQLAVCFEWAREGIARQTAGEISPELEALHAAYAHARDVMLETAKKNGG